MKILKAAARLSYDIDGLIKTAFDTLKPFSKRRHLAMKQQKYIDVLRTKFEQRAQLRRSLSGRKTKKEDSMTTSTVTKSQSIDCMAIDVNGSRLGLLLYGCPQGACQLALIDIAQSAMRIQSLKFDCRAVCMAFSRSSNQHTSVGFISLVSDYLVAITIEDGVCRRLWEMKMADTVLQMLCFENKLFAALGNGSVGVLENCCVRGETPSHLDVYYIPLGPAPITNLVLTTEHLWMTMSNKALILSVSTLDCVDTIHVAGNATGGGMGHFDRVSCTTYSPVHGIFLCTQHSTLIQLWCEHSFTCRLLHDMDTEHSSPQSHEACRTDTSHITTMLCHDTQLWIGTADGYLIMYEIEATGHQSSSTSSVNQGKRVSPANSPNVQLYIPPRSSQQKSNHAFRATGHSTKSTIRAKAHTKELLTRTKSSQSVQKEQADIISQVSMHDSTVDAPKCLSRSLYDLHQAGELGSLRKQSATSALFLNRLIQSTRRKRSSTSCDQTQFSSESNESLVYDNYVKLYDDEAIGARRSVDTGGLCADQLMRSSSVLSLQHSLPCLSVNSKLSFASSLHRNNSFDLPDCQIDPITLRRKDLQFDDCEQSNERQSDSASVISFVSSMPVDLPFDFLLKLQMKLKISDQPVKCLTSARQQDGQVVILSCAGAYNDDEAILKWTKEESTQLWINQPIVDANCKNNRYGSVSALNHVMRKGILKK